MQAFPDANHTVDDKFKVIYGVEAYLVDDTKDIVENAAGQSLDDKYVVFDIETTGFSPEKNKIIEIGAVKVIGGEIVDRYSTFINPEVRSEERRVGTTWLSHRQQWMSYCHSLWSFARTAPWSLTTLTLI